MRLAALSVLLVIAVVSMLNQPESSAQSVPNMEKGASQQWLSHQMFQPPPSDSEKQNISDKTIEEIRRLYEEAKKEIEARNPSSTKLQKP